MRLYIVHANWCYHCMEAMPSFRALRDQQAELGVPVTLVESSDLALPRYSELRPLVPHFPTLILRNRTHTIMYTGRDRSVDALRAWVAGWKAHAHKLR